MKRPFLLICICLAGFIACHDEHEIVDPPYVDPPVTPQEPQTSLIKTVTVGTETTTYTYDDQRRVINSAYSDGSAKREYLDGLVIQRIYKENGSLDYFNSMEINEERLMVNRTVSNNPSYLETYEYDIARRLIKTISINGTNVFSGNYFYTEGNLDSVVYIRNNELQYTYKYTYLTKPNTLNNQAYGTAYNGVDNKNLVKNWTCINAEGKIFRQFSYTYTYDHKGRVADMTQVTHDDVDTYSYTYY